MSTHGALSVVLAIKEGQKANLISRLEAFDKNNSIPFNTIESLHFARFVVIDSGVSNDGETFADQIIFSSNYDLPHNDHFRALADKTGHALWEIFSHCRGFISSDFNADALFNFIKTNNYKAATFYVGVGMRSVQQIKNENQLHTEIISYIDTAERDFDKKSANEIRNDIIKHIHSKPQYSWVKSKAKTKSIGENILFFGKYVLGLIVFLALLPLIIPFLIVWMILLRRVELREPKANVNVPKKHIRTLVNREDQMVQAQFTAVGNVKPGAVRKLSVQFLLWLTNSLAPLIFSKGKLSGIPTVHFARWLLIHDSRYMIFLSNYDGNSETYLQDFINIATQQLTLLFTHTEGFPETKFLVFKGAKDSNGFMDWARINQTVTNYWYNANPELNLKNIWNNGEIRNGFYGNMSEGKAAKWLQKI